MSFQQINRELRMINDPPLLNRNISKADIVGSDRPKARQYLGKWGHYQVFRWPSIKRNKKLSNLIKFSLNLNMEIGLSIYLDSKLYLKYPIL